MIFKNKVCDSKMQNILQQFIIIVIIIFSGCFADNTINVCSNGVFKCVSPTSLRICFHGTLISSEFFCPNSSYCSEDSENICVPYEELSSIQNPLLNCTQEGMFPIENSCCTKYLKCSKKLNSFLPKELGCYNGQLFDPVSKSCSSDYICQEICKPLEVPDCSETGNLPIPNTGCLKYVICKETPNGIQSTVKNCFTGSLFNPTVGRCERNYVCTDSDQPINTTPTTTAGTPIVSSSTPTVLCTESGKYLILSSQCKKYRLCTKTVNGFVSKVYECPSGSLFNPDIHRCSKTYICSDDTAVSDNSTVTPLDLTSVTTKYYTASNTTTDIISNVTCTQGIDFTVTESTITTTISGENLSSFPQNQSSIANEITTPVISTTVSDIIGNSTTSPKEKSTLRIETEESSERVPYSTLKFTEDPQITSLIITTVSNIIGNSTTSPKEETTPTIATEKSSERVPYSTFKSTKDSQTTPVIISTVSDITDNSTTSPKEKSTLTIDTQESSDKVPYSTLKTTEDSQNTPVITTTVSNIIGNSTTSPKEELTSTIETEEPSEILPNSTLKPTEDPQSTPVLTTAVSDIFDNSTTSPKEELTSTIETEEPSEIFPNSTLKPTENSENTPIITTAVSDIIDNSTTSPKEELTSTIKTEEPSEILPNSTLKPTEDPQSTPIITTAVTDIIGNSTTSPKEELTSTIKTEEPSEILPNSTLKPTEDPQSTPIITTAVTDIIDNSTTSPKEELTSTIKTEEPSEILPNSTIKLTEDPQSTPIITTAVTDIIDNSTTSPKEELTSTIKTEEPSEILPNSTIKPTEDPQSTPSITTTVSDIIHNSTTSPKEEPTSTIETEEPSEILPNSTIKPTEKPQNTCVIQGKFPLPNTNCKKFLHCILTLDGFKEQVNECSDDTNFDPLLKRCTESYACLESETTNLIPSTSSPKPQTCVIQGRFPVANSGCKKFIVCTLTTSGLKEQEYECDDGLLFDPLTKKCNNNYKCDEFNAPLTVTTESSLVCQEQGKFPVENSDCKKYILCISTVSGFKFRKYECPEGSLYNPFINKCSTSYICEETTENTNSECFEDNEHVSEPECIKEGRFPVLKTNCNKYILCIKTFTGYKSKIYECPIGAAFDPNKQRCIKNHKCLEMSNKCKATTINDQTTEITPIKSNCTAEGKKLIPGTNCKNFLLCINTVAKGFISAVYTCPGNSVFSSENGRCIENHICEENTRASKILCATVGRYPDLYDRNCKYYYICIEKSEQEVQGIRKQCKDGYYFDPEIQKCSSSYICHSKKGVLARSLFTDVISPRFLVNGRCTTVGRYMVELTNCKNYVYCSANPNGTLKATNFTCPTTTVFNQAIQKCTAAYTCPDSFCINNPGLISWANPNVRDCSSYIDCEPVWNQFGMLLGYKGVIKYCPAGMYFNPVLSACDSMYICPNT